MYICILVFVYLCNLAGAQRQSLRSGFPLFLRLEDRAGLSFWVIGVTPGPADSSNIPSMGSCQTILVPDNLVPDNLVPDNLVLDNLVPDNLVLGNLVPDNSSVRLFWCQKIWCKKSLVSDNSRAGHFWCQTIFLSGETQIRNWRIGVALHRIYIYPVDPVGGVAKNIPMSTMSLYTCREQMIVNIARLIISRGSKNLPGSLFSGVRRPWYLASLSGSTSGARFLGPDHYIFDYDCVPGKKGSYYWSINIYHEVNFSEETVTIKWLLAKKLKKRKRAPLLISGAVWQVSSSPCGSTHH